MLTSVKTGQRSLHLIASPIGYRKLVYSNRILAKNSVTVLEYKNIVNVDIARTTNGRMAREIL